MILLPCLLFPLFGNASLFFLLSDLVSHYPGRAAVLQWGLRERLDVAEEMAITDTEGIVAIVDTVSKFSREDKSETYPSLLSSSVLLPELFLSVLSLHCQIRVLFDLGLVEPIDNRVLPLGDVYAFHLYSIRRMSLVQVLDTWDAGLSTNNIISGRTYLSLILETHLTNSHAPILLQI